MSATQSPPVPPTPAPALDYANPYSRDAAPPGNKLLVLAVSVAVAFLGANAFADAAGFSPVTRTDDGADVVVPRILCGVVLFVLSLAVVAALLRAFRATADALARTPERP